MVKKPPLPFRPRTPTPRPFPTRGVPDRWRDAWDANPLVGVRLGRPTADIRRRSVCDTNLRVELVAHARNDGRWVATVVAHQASGPASGSATQPASPSSAAWPSVNGPTAMTALDALEAELRDAARGAMPEEC